MTHPAPETLAEFIDGKLHGEPRDAVVEHIEECDDCLMIVGETARLFEEAPAIPRRRTKIWPLLAAAVIGIAFFATWTLHDRLFEPVFRLAGASRTLDTRLVEGRIEGFDHRPFQPMRGGAESAPTDPKLVELDSVATEIREQNSGDKESARKQHAAGLAALITGHRSEAIPMLQRATTLSPNTSRYWNDYAVALLDEGRFDEALNATAKAIERDPGSAAARFDRALALELLGRVPEAISAWNDYLKLDGRSPWATEAASHREQLKRRRG